MFHPFVASDIKEDAAPHDPTVGDLLNAAFAQRADCGFGIIPVVQLIVVPDVSECVVLCGPL